MTNYITYKEAGVDIDAGESMVKKIQTAVKSTMRKEVLSGLGGFSSLVAIPAGYKEPVLVSGTDGVGTKLKLAFAMGIHDTVGIDLVAMCVNDCLVSGAEPLFFLDYYACSKLDPAAGAAVVSGIAEGCRQAGCALVGGETAELPGFYQEDEYDLAGFCVGVVERTEILDGGKVREGDAVLGLSSTGLHSNGFSLARAIVERSGASLQETPPGMDEPLGKALLTPTRIYVKTILSLRKQVELRALAHITGGGLTENIPRTLPEGLGVHLQAGWPVPSIFRFLGEKGPVEQVEMLRTFNMGIGMTAVVPSDQANRAIDHLRQHGTPAQVIGRVIKVAEGSPRVVIEGAV
jgi:phosphoribosylformylglycinamidine cyclo-ligase